MKEISKPQINIAGFNGSRALMPNTIDEAYRIAQAFSKSDFIPKEYKDKPDNCFTAINLGMEIGLPPMRALQSIAVVNGKPCIYGDAQLALVRGSGLLESFTESYEGKESDADFAAICILKRKGDTSTTTERFTICDAKKAGLWGKVGPWTTHPKRMLRYKARAFALRDKFADVLLGLTHSVEEMQGEFLKDITHSKTAQAHAAVETVFAEEQPAIEQENNIESSLISAINSLTSTIAVDKFLEKNSDYRALEESNPEVFGTIFEAAENRKASIQMGG
jgi:hypothetical protein